MTDGGVFVDHLWRNLERHVQQIDHSGDERRKASGKRPAFMRMSGHESGHVLALLMFTGLIVLTLRHFKWEVERKWFLS